MSRQDFKSASFLLILILLIQSGCKQTSISKGKAFYHWQTQLQIDSTEQALLDQLAVDKLYVKFFDVDWDAGSQQLVPKAILKPAHTSLGKIREIVPTVFITNRSFLESSQKQQIDLSKKVAQKLEQLIRQLPQHIKVQEIQLDCDWTAKSQTAFFSFLEQLKTTFQQPSYQLSATIRLHQFAQVEATGVPPVDRGMLMFYNMGQLEDWQENNSILSLEAALPYLNKKARQYPLALDLALPAFSWGVLYRDGKLTHLINDLQLKELQDTARFQALSPFRFLVKKSNYLKGQYLYKNDLIRVETIDTALLGKTKVLLDPIFAKQSYTTAIYHLDAAVLKEIPHAQLQELLD